MTGGEGRTVPEAHAIDNSDWKTGRAHVSDVMASLAQLPLATLKGWGERLYAVLDGGGRLLVGGNGGSAAEAQHLTAELVGRFRDDRRPFSAIALHSESSSVSAIANDYSWDEVFARQVRAHGRPGDIVLLLSTSGASPSVVRAAQAARSGGMAVWALTGPSPSPLAAAADEVVAIDAPVPAVQECHLTAVHLICMAFEGALSRDGADDRAPAEPATLALPPQARPPAAESLRHPVLTTRPAAPRGRSRAHADRIVVIGDTLLDRDTTGQVNRLSPEAPIPVVEAMSTVSRPGGAGLTALLAAHYGKQVVLITALADDDPADDLRRMLRDAGVELIDHGLTGTTPVKSRIRAAGRSLLMLDGAPPPGRIVRELSTEGAAAIAASGSVIVSDYGRGITSVASVRSALAEAASRVPLVWDPHPKGAAPVPGVRVVTPNAREAAHFTGTPQGGDLNAQTQQARELVRRWSAASIAVTLGDRGAMLVEDQDLPALVVPVPERAAGARPADSCGAGDVFAARTAVQLADGALLSEAIIGSVWAASAYVTAGGPAGLAAATPVREAADGRSVDALELAARVRAAGGTVVATGGCFDLLHRGHISLLEQARQLGDCLIVCLNSDESVSRLKGQSRPVVTMPDRALVLSALQSVDAVVVFEEDTPLRLLERLRPHIFVKGGDYSNMVIPEAKAVRAWGGEVVTVPYLAGRSTSSLITRAVRGANA